MSATANYRIQESYLGRERVDREAGVIYGVRVLNRESRNNRRYRPSAISQAKGLYEGAKVNIDHAFMVELRKANPGRKFDDFFGELRNVRESKDASGKVDGLIADLHYLTSHPMAERVTEAADKFPNQFGLSHDANGRVEKDTSTGVMEVVEILKVNSVDVVHTPGSTSSLFESLDMSKITIARVAESCACVKEMVAAEPGMATMEMGVEGDASPEGMWREAIKMMVNAVIDDTSLDQASMFAKLKRILALKSDDGKPEEAKVEESLKAKSLEEEVTRLRGELDDMGIKALFESAGVEMTDIRKKAVKGIPVGDRKSLVESFPKAKATERPASSKGVSRMTESKSAEAYDPDKVKALFKSKTRV